MSGRLFVYLLLICDFWGDPGLAVSPLARPLFSTPSTCQELVLNATLLRSIREPHREPSGPDGLGVRDALFQTVALTETVSSSFAVNRWTFATWFYDSIPLCYLLQRLHR